MTRAHRGVLFLDELGEFRRDALEALRAPLEDGAVTVARTSGTVSLPCRFMLVAASNPCPCGNGPESGECECHPGAVTRYQAKLSGALADRIDITHRVDPPPAEELVEDGVEDSATVRERVARARRLAEARLGSGRANAEMTPAEVRLHCGLDAESQRTLERAHRKLRLSARGWDRCVRLARTIADLAGESRISAGSRRRGDRPPAATRPVSGNARPRACGECLRRAWLVASLAGHIDKAVSDTAGNRARELLALSNEELAEAMARSQARSFLQRARERDPVRMLAAVTGSGAWASCRHDELYPEPLHDLGDAPAVIFGRGRAATLGEPGAPRGGDDRRLTAAEPLRPGARDGAGRRARSGRVRGGQRHGPGDRFGCPGGSSAGRWPDDRGARLRGRRRVSASQRAASTRR